MTDPWGRSQMRRNSFHTSPAPTPRHSRTCHKLPKHWVASGLQDGALIQIANPRRTTRTFRVAQHRRRSNKRRSFRLWPHIPILLTWADGICRGLPFDSGV
jgi:hypothetical protein